MLGMEMMAKAAIEKLLENPDMKEKIVSGLQIISNIGAQLARIEAQNAEILVYLKREFGENDNGRSIPKFPLIVNGSGEGTANGGGEGTGNAG